MLLPTREVKSLPIAEIEDAKVVESLVHPVENLFPGKPQVFETEGDLVEHEPAHDLTFWILQEGSYLLREFRHFHLVRLTSVQPNLSRQLSAIAARNEPVDTAH